MRTEARHRGRVAAAVALVLWAGANPAGAGDWPMRSGDAARSGRTADALPASLCLRWVRQLATPRPAWPESQHKLQFDASYEPVVAGKRLFVSSMVADRVTAYDTESGGELWRFYADGPLRFAPVVWQSHVYVASDDGRLYCLDAATGRRQWALRGGPDGRLGLGNERLISLWPARGAPVLCENADGSATVYVAASIWPFMGTFLYAVDAESGAVRWSNSGSGATHGLQPHASPAFAGVAPQGYLAAAGDILLVSGGRAVPAAYRRSTGEFLYYNASDLTFGKEIGHYDLRIAGEYVLNGGCLYGLADGKPALKTAAQVIGESVLAAGTTNLDVCGLELTREEKVVRDNRGKDQTKTVYRLPAPQSLALSAPLRRFFCQAGGRVYGAGDGGLIGAVNLPGTEPAGVSWTGRVDGAVWTMVPADGKLFVVTAAGAIHCFGADAAGPVTVHELPERAGARSASGAPASGYCLVWGLGEGAFDRLAALARDYHVIAADPDAARVEALRRALDDAGLYGGRVHVLAGAPATLGFPPYLASRLEVGDLRAAGFGAGADFAGSVFRCLRPYGGTAVAAGPAAELAAFERAVADAGLESARLAPSADGRALELRREGPLPGAAPWTHQYADVANTVVSQDERVKPPLGLLWFGGPSNDDVLPRHGHGPAPQVVGGRLFIEGPDALRAIDVYTGRLLWQRELKGLGRFYDNTIHQPGAGEIGSNYVSLEDGVYVVLGGACLRLDPATGETVREFRLPRQPGKVWRPHWGYVGVSGERLLAGATPVAMGGPTNAPLRVEQNAPYASSSRQLVVMNRHDGEVLWSRPAAQLFRHNAIAAGAGRVFCIDAISPANRDRLKRRGEEPKTPPVLLALDEPTGRVAWQAVEDVFGTWLGYSAANDVLIEAGSPARDRAPDEAAGRMRAYRGRDGQVLWQGAFRYSGTPMLHGTTIYTDGKAFDLLTGKPRRRDDPITGLPMDWTFSRMYGCNTPIAGRHLLLFRSAAAGYYDLDADAGTANWGGFKSGCTANLIPADGVLTAVDYTRTCTCDYQNQSSLALVPMPDVEVWTFQSYASISGAVARVGVNFGAPGDWRAPGGTLWLDHPSVGGMSPSLSVEVEGEATYFRGHAMEMQGPAGPVTASGVENARAIRIAVRNDVERAYTVRLYFSEPRATAAGERVFGVRLQGRPVIEGLDVFAEAGGRRRGLVREFTGIAAGETLSVELVGTGTPLTPLLCGVEVIAQPAGTQPP